MDANKQIIRLVEGKLDYLAICAAGARSEFDKGNYSDAANYLYDAREALDSAADALEALNKGGRS